MHACGGPKPPRFLAALQRGAADSGAEAASQRPSCEHANARAADAGCRARGCRARGYSRQCHRMCQRRSPAAAVALANDGTPRPARPKWEVGVGLSRNGPTCERGPTCGRGGAAPGCICSMPRPPALVSILPQWVAPPTNNKPIGCPRLPACRPRRSGRPWRKSSSNSRCRSAPAQPCALPCSSRPMHVPAYRRAGRCTADATTHGAEWCGRYVEVFDLHRVSLDVLVTMSGEEPPPTHGPHSSLGDSCIRGGCGTRRAGGGAMRHGCRAA